MAGSEHGERHAGERGQRPHADQRRDAATAQDPVAHHPAERFADGAGELAAVSDAHGRFAFARLVPGQYRITLARNGAEPLVTQVFAGATGAPVELTLKCE
ncbi:MAG: carboxypeptidase regulatory-like domain-containing protein [Planctomycetes bacterium]|nr:carboxypeptidase regulatory-like domain-containing protein [Planctomycetota bacterium]